MSLVVVWDVLFDDGLLTLDALASVTARVHVIEGSQTSASTTRPATSSGGMCGTRSTP
jgi:hypothetical protein